MFPSCRWRWSTKQFILAAIYGTIAAAAIITVVSYALRPAPIEIKITRVAPNRVAHGAATLTANLTFTAANPSHRAGVLYRNFVVSNDYTTLRGCKTLMYSVMEPTVPFSQQPASPAFPIQVQVESPSLGLDDDMSLIDITVMVKTTVMFKVGHLYSLPYTVKLACKHVNFTQQITRAPISCQG